VGTSTQADFTQNFNEGLLPGVAHSVLSPLGGSLIQCCACEYVGCIGIVVVTAATATANVAVSIIASVLDIGSLG
jgi:hypothetical protein